VEAAYDKALPPSPRLWRTRRRAEGGRWEIETWSSRGAGEQRARRIGRGAEDMGMRYDGGMRTPAVGGGGPGRGGCVRSRRARAGGARKTREPRDNAEGRQLVFESWRFIQFGRARPSEKNTRRHLLLARNNGVVNSRHGVNR